MTDFCTNFVPQDPTFFPTDEAVEAAKSLLLSFYPDWIELEIRKYSTPQFITSGDDFDRFTCPACKTLVKARSLDEEGQEWWYVKFLAARDPEQPVKVPCCGAEVKIKDFDFDKHAAFARFVLAAEGTEYDDEVTDSQMKELEVVLGCPVRKIVEVRT